ncbi:MAG: hypothetical protein FD180_2948 [Planctomycetota bacterium]|nr:MAG: hypothetical protein FD180_2948 [Planctomycetota bacterium]
MRATFALLTVLLASCSPFPDHFGPGTSEKFEFRMTNGFWKDTYSAATPIASGGFVVLEARTDLFDRPLVAVAADPAVVEISTEPVAPARTSDGLLWRFTVRAVACGKTAITLRDGEAPVDSIELTVADPGEFRWETFEDSLEGRCYPGALLVHPQETVEIAVWAYDASGQRMAGAEAWTLEAGGTYFPFETQPDVLQACNWTTVRAGARAPILVSGKEFGWTEMVFRHAGGLEMKIKATCGWGIKK